MARWGIKQVDEKPEDDPCERGDHDYRETSRTTNYNGTVSVIGTCSRCPATISHLAQ